MDDIDRAQEHQQTRQLSSRDLPSCVYLALKALEQGDPQAAREFEQWLCLLCSYDFVVGSGEK